MDLLPDDPNQAFRISDDDLPVITPSEVTTLVDGADAGAANDEADSGVDENQPPATPVLAFKELINGE